MGDTLMPGVLLVNGIESDNEDLEFDCIGAGKTIKFKRDGVEVASIDDGGFVGADNGFAYAKIDTGQIGTTSTSNISLEIVKTDLLVLDSAKYNYFAMGATSMHQAVTQDGANIAMSYRIDGGAWISLGAMNHRGYLHALNRYPDIIMHIGLPTAVTGNVEVRYTGGSYNGNLIYFRFSAGGHGFGSMQIIGVKK